MKPILFNTDMVRAILDGRKTVTRRVVKERELIDRPPYRTGDILYVRETWRLVDFDYIDGKWSANVSYKADCGIGPRLRYLPHGSDERCGWRPSIHMPREAARIFLRVTGVRVERLQEIDDAQAYAEGAEGVSCNCDVSEVFCSRCCNTGWLISPRSEFARIWDSTIKPKDRALCGWEANPWVWGIEFERCGKPKGD